jgi:hypothetical protein
MSTEPRPIDARANVSLIAAFLLIVGLGVLTLRAVVHPASGSMYVPSTEAVAEWGD